MYISVVTLYADDVDRAIDFYTKKLGFTKTMDVQMGPDMRWVTVAPPNEKTELHLAKSDEEDKAGGFTGIILEVDDVFATSATLKKAGIELQEEPRNEPWGGWAMLKDSEGNVLGLHSPVPAAVSKN
jgi:lactoylglutathione lyase